MCLRAVLTWLSCPWYQDSISLSLSASLSLSLPLLSFSPTIIKTHQLVKGNLKSNLKKCFYSYAFSFLACLFDLVLFLFRKRRRITQKFPSQRPLQVLGWFLFLFLKKRAKQIAAGARVFTSTACPDLFRELVPHSGQILRPPAPVGSWRDTPWDAFILPWPENSEFQRDSIPNAGLFSFLLPASTFSLSPKIKKYF